MDNSNNNIVNNLEYSQKDFIDWLKANSYYDRYVINLDDCSIFPVTSRSYTAAKTSIDVLFDNFKAFWEAALNTNEADIERENIKKQSKIALRIQEIQHEIQLLENEREAIRVDCSHSITFEGVYSWRPGVAQLANICKSCGALVSWLDNGQEYVVTVS